MFCVGFMFIKSVTWFSTRFSYILFVCLVLVEHYKTLLGHQSYSLISPQLEHSPTTLNFNVPNYLVWGGICYEETHYARWSARALTNLVTPPSLFIMGRPKVNLFLWG